MCVCVCVCVRVCERVCVIKYLRVVNPANVGIMLNLRLKVDQLLLRIVWSSPDCCDCELNLILLQEIMTREGRNKQQKSWVSKILLVGTVC